MKTSKGILTHKHFLKASLCLSTVAFVGLGTLSADTPPSNAIKEDKQSNPSGFFVGAELGWSALFTKTTTTRTNTQVIENSSSFPPLGNVGVKLGYTHFFNKYIGIRGYANYHYSYQHSYAETTQSDGSKRLEALLSYHQVVGNIEATFRFFDFGVGALGAYAGIGAGYATSNTSATAGGTTIAQDTDLTNGFVLPVNVGLEVYMGKHHNASLNFRIPTIATLATTTATAQGTSTTTKTQERNLIITLGYSYTF